MDNKENKNIKMNDTDNKSSQLTEQQLLYCFSPYNNVCFRP